MIKFDDWMIEGIDLNDQEVSCIAAGNMLLNCATSSDWLRILSEDYKNEVARANNYLRIDSPKCI